MPSNTFAVIWSKSTCAVIASIDSSMIIDCTAGSSTSGARDATNASSSTSWIRAQALTIETGTRIVAMTMSAADRSARHQPARLRRSRCDLVFGHALLRAKLLVLCTKRRKLGLQIVVGYGGHEASSVRMTSLWRKCASRIPP